MNSRYMTVLLLASLVGSSACAYAQVTRPFNAAARNGDNIGSLGCRLSSQLPQAPLSYSRTARNIGTESSVAVVNPVRPTSSTAASAGTGTVANPHGIGARLSGQSQASVRGVQTASRKPTPVIGRDQRGWVNPQAAKLSIPTTTYRGVDGGNRKAMIAQNVERFTSERLATVTAKLTAKATASGLSAMHASFKIASTAKHVQSVARSAVKYRNAILFNHNKRWIKAACAPSSVKSRGLPIDVKHDATNAAVHKAELAAQQRGRLSHSMFLNMERRVGAGRLGDSKTWFPKVGDGLPNAGRDRSVAK